jgi:hypothetical protein
VRWRKPERRKREIRRQKEGKIEVNCGGKLCMKNIIAISRDGRGRRSKTSRYIGQGGSARGGRRGVVWRGGGGEGFGRVKGLRVH